MPIDNTRCQAFENKYNETYIDKFLLYPVFVVLSEGRKFGIGVCMVSQRPSKLDPDSISQCMTQITMRIINPTDQQQIAQSIESARGLQVIPWE